MNFDFREWFLKIFVVGFLFLLPGFVIGTLFWLFFFLVGVPASFFTVVIPSLVTSIVIMYSYQVMLT